MYGDVTSHFSGTVYMSLLEHFHPHKHIYNAQTYKIMNEHIYIGKITKYREQGWNYISHNCPKLCSWSRRPEITFENQKGLICWGNQQACYLQVLFPKQDSFKHILKS